MSNHLSIWVITAYFNWDRFQTKLENYRLFRDQLATNSVNLLTIECALGNRSFELSGSNILHVRTDSVMWQKERLLNLAVKALPSTCSLVAWVDCDLLFTNQNWAAAAIDALSEYPVIQLFSSIVRLDRGGIRPKDIKSGFIAKTEHDSKSRFETSMHSHGHTGFAWAARRSVLSDIGLYDTCVLGGADHAMAHVFRGDIRSACIPAILRGKSLPHFMRWAFKCDCTVQGKVGFINNILIHLWHGEIAYRQYEERHSILPAHEYDPDCDISANHDGCLEWATDKAALHSAVREYFSFRREDG